MSAFGLPSCSFSSSDIIIRKFWYIDNINKQYYLSFIPWNKIYLSKDFDGLDIRQFEDFNQAMLSKIVWDIIEQPQKLWVQNLDYKYLQHSSFLNMSTKFLDSFV